MHLNDMIGYSTNALRRRTIRSWLTILGIVIGITAIVVLIGLVQGLREDINKQLAGFGSRTVAVIPVNIEQSGSTGAGSFAPTNGKLFMKDYERLKRIPELEAITPVINGRTYVRYKNKYVTTSIVGVEPTEYKETVGNLETQKGRFLVDADRKTAVVGGTLATEYFPDPIEISSELTISDKKYRVVGILNKTGNSFVSIDTIVIIPMDEAREMFNDVLLPKEISGIRMSVKDGVNPGEIAERIENEMLAAHRLTRDKKDFSVISSEFINKQLDGITAVLALFLGGIAGISLFVGGIGIANTMFMSVTERRREIGTLKSLGAREEHIMRLFLVESSIIGFTGGAIGILLAYGVGYLVTAYGGISVSISPFVVIGATVFSALVGIISGLIPAKQAARLDPVDALRS